MNLYFTMHPVAALKFAASGQRGGDNRANGDPGDITTFMSQIDVKIVLPIRL